MYICESTKINVAEEYKTVYSRERGAGVSNNVRRKKGKKVKKKKGKRKEKKIEDPDVTPRLCRVYLL